jgi:hypothetical protein
VRNVAVIEERRYWPWTNIHKQPWWIVLVQQIESAGCKIAGPAATAAISGMVIYV